MKTVQCDVCKWLKPEVSCSRKIVENISEYFTVQNITYICEQCWQGFQEFMSKKVKEEK